MHDEMNAHGGPEHTLRTPVRQANEEARPLADREVPLGSVRTAAVQGWLDGEISETDVRDAGGQRDVAFWARVSEETGRRRQVTTPTHVLPAIMAALPQSAPLFAEPWHRRDVTLSASAAMVAGAGLLLLGLLLGAVAR